MGEYTGGDNLEVMKEAVNYNGFLKNLVLQYAGDSEKILDFGAGRGTFAQLLAEEGRRVLCLEPDRAQAGMIADAGSPVVTALDEIGAESLEFIYSLNVLEHIEADQEAMMQLSQKLQAGGRMLIYVPAFMLLFSGMDRKVGHFRRYSAASLAALAQRCGLEIEVLKYADSAGFLATLLYKLVGSSEGSISRRSLRLYDRYIFPVSRAFDRIFSSFLGKNVYIVCKKKQPV